MERSSSMENVESVSAGEKGPLGLGTVLLRVVIGLNFIRFALSFVPWFEGTASAAGFADSLFNPRHTGGFRSDMLWLIVSSVYIFFAMFVYVPEFAQEKTARINVLLGFAWLFAFCFYVYRSLVTGTLYFG
jgi:hypothetical protein